MHNVIVDEAYKHRQKADTNEVEVRDILHSIHYQLTRTLAEKSCMRITSLKSWKKNAFNATKIKFPKSSLKEQADLI